MADSKHTRDEAKAEADRLRDAAPDLLEALRDCYLSMRAVGHNLQLFADIDGRVDPKGEYLMKQSTIARAAIAKAEGRS